MTLPEHLEASAAQLYMEEISSAGQMLGAAATTRYVNQDSEGLSRYLENITPEERAFWVEGSTQWAKAFAEGIANGDLNASTFNQVAKTFRNNRLPGAVGGDSKAKNGGIDGVWDQGRFTPIQRGNAIEDHLAGTDYNGWTRVGSQDNGFSPAWDFNQGSTWVSLKTLDTGGSGWQTSMRSHIRELETWSSPTNPNAAKVLDIRVQPGGAASAQSLIDYGASRGVQVRINEF